MVSHNRWIAVSTIVAFTVFTGLLNDRVPFLRDCSIQVKEVSRKRTGEPSKCASLVALPFDDVDQNLRSERNVSFVIYNTGKTGSHFLTQTLTLLGLPVAFEYGLRKGHYGLEINETTSSVTENALKQFKNGKYVGFSGAHFEIGKLQRSIDHDPTDWAGIVKALSTVSQVKHVVLLRTNALAWLLSYPAGTRKIGDKIGFTVSDLTRLRLESVHNYERIMAALIKAACSNSIRESHGQIFVVTYESLLTNPQISLNQLLTFLGSDPREEQHILRAIENGAFKKRHDSTIYSDLGTDAITKNLFHGQKGMDSTLRDCVLHQALTLIPQEQNLCFEGCSLRSGGYACSSLD